MSQEAHGNPMVSLETPLGRIRLELWPDAAPITVENFLTYVKEGFYDGLLFHRVVPHFVVQTGGFEPGMVYRTPTHPPIENEARNGKSNSYGTLAMARALPINSAAAQFFINMAENAMLDHKGMEPQIYGYTVFGRVAQGMDVVEVISQMPRGNREGHQNVPLKDIIIIRAWLEEDS